MPYPPKPRIEKESDDPNVRYIPLTRGLYAIIDASDYGLVSSRPWYAEPISGAKGIFRASTGAVDSSGKRMPLRMHRLIVNAPEGMDVDHKDGNPLNNRRSNLRVCTHAENMRNMRRSKANTSGFKGVYFDKKRGKWHAQISMNDSVIFLGRYDTAEEGHAAYCAKAVQLSGEFARTE